MQLVRRLCTLLTLFSAVAAAQVPRVVDPPAPPKTEVKEVRETIHGVEIVDPYRWLEDQNSPETRRWIEAENSYAKSVLGRAEGREALERKVAGLLNVEEVDPPTVRNGRYFFTRSGVGEDQASLYLRRGASGKDELLVDPLKLSPDHTITVRVRSASRDGSLIVYALRKGGEDEVTPHVLNVDERKELPDKLPRARYNDISLLPDKSGFYYSTHTAEGPRVLFHKLGTSADQDKQVFGQGYGPEKILDSELSTDGRYLVMTLSHGSAPIKTEIYYQDLKTGGAVTALANDVTAAFQPSVAEDTVYLHTNWNAPNWRVLAVNLKAPDRSNWKEVVPQSDAVLQGITLAGHKIVARYTKDVITRLKIFGPDGKFVRDIDPPAIGSLSAAIGHWENDESFYVFNSFHMAATIFKYDQASGKQAVWHETKVPLDPSQYEVKQVWYSSKDGTKVPMFLAHKKGLVLDGSHPALLTGYGGFDSTSLPGFSALAAAWISNGGIYAVANLRGGGEFGEAWHRAGMLEHKQNVFDDFIAAGEWLVNSKYTTPSRLAISGGSNGGLLVGAALTQRPDLFAAVICAAPLLDMVRYHKFLMAPYWVPEYGSSDDPEQFKFIYAYSPYQHVKTGTKYPAVLFITGDSDTRVAPLHARKMTALMQAAGSDKPVLLLYDTHAGHSGGKTLAKKIEDVTDELSFLTWQLGVGGAKKEVAGQR